MLLQQVLSTLFYGVLGIILMLLGYASINMILPYEFLHEIFDEKNPAAGVMVAGIFIAIAIIIRSATL